MSVVIETTVGDLTVDLFLSERPRACQNFLKLCKLKYYNFCLFHTVQQDFIAQTGDPLGTGKGGTSLYGILYGDQAKYFEAEKTPRLRHRKQGTLSFVSHGNHMLGSQFFITLAEDLQYLDEEHCVFGEVVEGHDVLVKLNNAICDENHQPYQDIRVTHTVVLDDPLEDPGGLELPDRSPPLTDSILSSGRIAADEDLDESAARPVAELVEAIEEKEARARATILEMVGDLPDADAAPPENVLFVCKLNPVTVDDDLKVIFSRFGKVVSCEIIRDQRTGNSLQYGFIEFDNPKSCENAYFKMDNVLIDDRRIHVDFSQSVSRVRWRGRGRLTYENGASAHEFADYGARRAGPGGGGGRSGRGRGADAGRSDRTTAAGRVPAGERPPRYGVTQLRALIGKRDASRSDDEGSKESTKVSKKSKKHSKRSRHDSDSDSESESSGDAGRSAAEAKRRNRSASASDSSSPRHQSSGDKHRHRKSKKRERDDVKAKHKKRSKKHKKHTRKDSSSNGDSSSEDDSKKMDRKRKEKRK